MNGEVGEEGMRAVSMARYGERVIGRVLWGGSYMERVIAIGEILRNVLANVIA